MGTTQSDSGGEQNAPPTEKNNPDVGQHPQVDLHSGQPASQIDKDNRAAILKEPQISGHQLPARTSKKQHSKQKKCDLVMHIRGARGVGKTSLYKRLNGEDISDNDLV